MTHAPSAPPLAPTIQRAIRHDGAGALAHYPHAVRVGDLVFVSGTSSRRPDGSHEGVELLRDASGAVVEARFDTKAQTAAVLRNIDGHLASVGLGLADLVDATVFLVDMADYAAMNAAWNEAFPDPRAAPARTTVAVAALPHPNLRVEIKATAAGAARR